MAERETGPRRGIGLAVGLVLVVHLGRLLIDGYPAPGAALPWVGLALELGLAGALAAGLAALVLPLGRWAPGYAAVGLLLVLEGLAPREPTPDSDGKGRTVVWITVDTLRRDHVGAYPDALTHELTPEIDAIFAEGVRFEQAVTTSPLTLPSHVAMLTGMAPWQTGVVQNGRPVPILQSAPRRLSADGFATGGFVSSAMLHPSLGLGRGFDQYVAPGSRRLWEGLPLAGPVARMRPGPERISGDRPGAETVAEALAWLDRQPSDSSVFLWVHLNEPHGPRGPTPGIEGVDLWEALGHPCDWSAHPSAIGRGGARAMRPFTAPLPAEGSCREADWSWVRDDAVAYSREVRAADAAVGALVEGLRARGRWDRAGVVVASDHGEDLVEHQALPGHQFWLSEAVVRVPLAMRDPSCADCAGTVRNDQVDLAQVASTLLALGGVSETLVAGGLQRPGPSRVATLGPAPYAIEGLSGSALQLSVRYHQAKVVVDELGFVQRYRLVADPGEREPWVSESEARQLDERIAAVAAAWADGRPSPGALSVAPPAPLPAEVQASLAQPGLRGAVVELDRLMLFAQAERLAAPILLQARAVANERARDESELQPQLKLLGYVE